MEADKLINNVAAAGIVTVDLKDFRPKEKSVFFDIGDHLHGGLIVKEKEFKESLSKADWEIYRNRSVAIGCRVDTIIPTWVYMMLAERLADIATCIEYSSLEALDNQLWKAAITIANFDHLAGQRVVVRAHPNLDPSLFVLITQRLKPLVKSLLYGEAGLPKVIFKL